MKKKNPLWEREKKRQRTQNLILLLKELCKNFTPIPTIFLLLFFLIGLLPIIVPNLIYENYKHKTIFLQRQTFNLGILLAVGFILIETVIGSTVYFIFRLKKRSEETDREMD